MKIIKSQKEKRLIFSLILILFLSLFLLIIQNTGVLQANSIDIRDRNFWEYENGIQKDANEFTINGNNETCWILIHSYTSTPKEMKELADKINIEFGDFVYVPRLKGHGKLPSHINDLVLDDWHFQIKNDYKNLKNQCNKINIVGSSIGGTIALKIAQENEINNLYLVNPFLSVPYKKYYILKLEDYLKFIGPIIYYSKKTKIAQINDKEGLKEHISYWNMPVLPIRNSLDFFTKTEENLYLINETILIQHSINDKTASFKSSNIIFNNINSQNKKIILFNRSNHLLLMDYDKKEAINNIISFEKNLRE